MCASRLSVDNNNLIEAAAISIGSCSVVAKRLHQLEQELIGQKFSAELCNSVAAHHVKDLSPIDDVRASAMYRQDSALELTKRSIATLVGASQ